MYTIYSCQECRQVATPSPAHMILVKIYDIIKIEPFCIYKYDYVHTCEECRQVAIIHHESIYTLNWFLQAAYLPTCTNMFSRTHTLAVGVFQELTQNCKEACQLAVKRRHVHDCSWCVRPYVSSQSRTSTRPITRYPRATAYIQTLNYI